MKKIKIPAELQRMSDIFSQYGFEAWLVGGAVRDIVRGKTASDWDVATNASPQDVTRIFHKVIPTGIDHGTVTVILYKHHIEVTTYRVDKGYEDGRHPDEVIYAATIEEDLSRRDFTMNAIAANLSNGTICDPFNGKEAIKKGIIKTVGNPLERFNEDGLRPVRAIRFASQLGFIIEKNTLDAIPLCANVTKKISIERFRDEFVKMLCSEKPSKALKLMEKTGMLSQFLPELINCRGVIQGDKRGYHQFDVLDHLYYACDSAKIYPVEKSPSEKKEGTATFWSIRIRLAALFHDIGKPCVKRVENHPEFGVIYTFYRHEQKSSLIAKNILERLRFPRLTIRYVCHLIEQHMFHYESTWSDAAIRRFLVRVTPPKGIVFGCDKDKECLKKTVDDLFLLRFADVEGMSNTPALLHKGPWSKTHIEFRDRIEDAFRKESALGLKDLVVSGKDLISFGIPSGKRIGIILQELLNTVIEDPLMNDKETLLNLAKRFIQKD